MRDLLLIFWNRSWEQRVLRNYATWVCLSLLASRCMAWVSKQSCFQTKVWWGHRDRFSVMSLYMPLLMCSILNVVGSWFLPAFCNFIILVYFITLLKHDLFVHSPHEHDLMSHSPPLIPTLPMALFPLYCSL